MTAKERGWSGKEPWDIGGGKGDISGEIGVGTLYRNNFVNHS